MGAEGNTRRFLLEDRSAALTREMTDLKELAMEVTEGATEHAEEAREKLVGVVDEAVSAAQEGGVEARGDGGARVVGHGGKGADGGNHLGGWGEARVDAPDPRIQMPLLESAGGGDGPLGGRCGRGGHRPGSVDGNR